MGWLPLRGAGRSSEPLPERALGTPLPSPLLPRAGPRSVRVDAGSPAGEASRRQGKDGHAAGGVRCFTCLACAVHVIPRWAGNPTWPTCRGGGGRSGGAGGLQRLPEKQTLALAGPPWRSPPCGSKDSPACGDGSTRLLRERPRALSREVPRGDADPGPLPTGPPRTPTHVSVHTPQAPWSRLSHGV